ncbi:MAG: ATP-binding cassette domain-containing protein [Candidatus Berkelbacteria bacterium]|nr:ATP-binding cassette domain-containing protein [Candidatus Berkelbacteria bacterium]
MNKEENVIEVKNLTKNFGKFCAVCEVNFSVKKGEILGLLGPNGAGKSTIIRILTTLTRPTKGRAKVANLDIEKKSDEVRKHIGLVAEKIILYNHLTADENLQFFGHLNGLSSETIKERSDRWLKRLSMEEWRDHQSGTYSTGMKQRINIARALLTEPEILFLDEPTLGLDPQTTWLIRDFIRELNKKGTAMILTTHDMHEAEILSDRVAIVDHGKIVALDTVENLKKLVPNIENPTLEDVFLELTGKDIRDTAKKSAPVERRGHFGGPTNNRVR